MFMKLMILGAQGVFYNGMFLSYLISPRICHRFVGHLEEEAVLTYSRVLEDLDAGRLPKWEKMEIPELAIRYWNMPEEHRTMRDLLLYIRADEAKHREGKRWALSASLVPPLTVIGSEPYSRKPRTERRSKSIRQRVHQPGQASSHQRHREHQTHRVGKRGGAIDGDECLRGKMLLFSDWRLVAE